MLFTVTPSRAGLVQIKNADVFVAFNLVLFLGMCVVVYYDRFLHYRGPGNLHEFFIYAAVIVAAIVGAWLKLRSYVWRSSVLVLLQCGIFAHFLGAFVRVGGGRLYDAVFLGIRYDKCVHFFNAFVASALLSHTFELMKLKLAPVRGLVIVLCVLGMGAGVEIVEYLVVLTVKNNGVGGYDNNMQDMIGNLLGGILFAVFSAVRSRSAEASTRNEVRPEGFES